MSAQQYSECRARAQVLNATLEAIRTGRDFYSFGSLHWWKIKG